MFSYNLCPFVIIIIIPIELNGVVNFMMLSNNAMCVCVCVCVCMCVCVCVHFTKSHREETGESRFDNFNRPMYVDKVSSTINLQPNRQSTCDLHFQDQTLRIVQL